MQNFGVTNEKQDYANVLGVNKVHYGTMVYV